MASVLTLSPDEAAPGRQFTDPARARDDLAALASIRASLVERVRAGHGGGTWSAGAQAHWLVLRDVSALARTCPAFGVGFFGQAREHVDHTAILELEHELLSKATAFPGLLAYHNVRFATGQWGNLVLFATEDDPARVRSDPRHVEALTRTADHYHSVRLHRLRFPEGATGDAAPTLSSTLLLDFSETPPWRAIRLA